MWYEYQVVADSERPQWDWVPFKNVGPLRFGQSAQEVADALAVPLSGYDPKSRWASFTGKGIDAYFHEEKYGLAAVAVNSFRGPQVSYNNVRLVGRLPSEITPWIEETGESLEELPPGLSGLRIATTGDPGLPGIGLVMRCQHNGDYARTRPLFVARDWAVGSMDSWEGPIPSREWGIF
ncbi:hypothetical protein ACFXAZ_38035 [Streptomyces sp. NPDC059477]|uniref:hypothetical protein n=1 Tax=Streptomyces sp. NPDC059477 TaxID=3346847 RepID=UPI0036BA346B